MFIVLNQRYSRPRLSCKNNRGQRVGHDRMEVELHGRAQRVSEVHEQRRREVVGRRPSSARRRRARGPRSTAAMADAPRPSTGSPYPTTCTFLWSRNACSDRTYTDSLVACALVRAGAGVILRDSMCPPEPVGPAPRLGTV